MSSRFNVVLPDDMVRELDKVATEDETSKGEILRRALQLYTAARNGRQRGLAVGMVDPTTREMKTEFVGL